MELPRRERVWVYGAVLSLSKYYRLLFVCLPAFCLGCSGTSNGLTSETSKEGVEILQDDTPVLFYQVAPRSAGGKYQRAGYIHPLYNLDGTAITEDFPDDHPHHHGVYAAWHQVMRNGEQVGDGWTSENISYEVADTKTTSGDQRITLTSTTVWKSEGIEVVRENTEMIAHRSDGNLRTVDYNFSLHPLTDGLELGGSNDEKGYGGFSFRLKLPPDIRFISQGGEVEPKVTAVDAGPWMDFTGSFHSDSRRSGVIVFSHPSNPGHPQAWILRREKSMQNLAFPGRTPVALNAEGWHFKYRIIIHREEIPVDEIQKLYENYAAAR